MEQKTNNIDPSLASKVLFLGIDYKKPKGGIAAVEKMYATVFSPFQFIRTVIEGNLFLKYYFFIEAICFFLYYMILKKNIRYSSGAVLTTFSSIGFFTERKRRVKAFLLSSSKWTVIVFLSKR